MTTSPLKKISYSMMRLMVRVMPSCKDISAQISEGMDRNLPLQKRLSIRLHVSMCGLCRRYEKQLHLIHQGASHYADPQKNATTPSLSPAAEERIRQALIKEISSK